MFHPYQKPNDYVDLNGVLPTLVFARIGVMSF
jgi:hypothetical protein